MTASELVKLIHRLQLTAPKAERLDFYHTLETYLVESDYDWQDHMNDPTEEGLIMSGVYLVWAQDREDGLNFWDTNGNRYLLPLDFNWDWQDKVEY
jgi:hypothetical protein